MLRGGISLEGRTDLHVLNRANLTGARCIDTIDWPARSPDLKPIEHL